jgi:hypothetical protein
MPYLTRDAEVSKRRDDPTRAFELDVLQEDRATHAGGMIRAGGGSCQDWRGMPRREAKPSALPRFQPCNHRKVLSRSNLHE